MQQQHQHVAATAASIPVRAGAARGGGSGAAYHRLKQLGMSDEEVNASRRKLAQLVQQLDPHASLSPEVEEVLLELSTKFVESAARFGCKLAQHRGSKHLELDDLRLYVETMLGVHVPGFGSTLTGALSATFYADAVQSGKPGRVSEEHAARLKLKRKAHVVMDDGFAVAVSAPPPANKKAKLP